ncbi:hypothetical protein XENTR_v10004184 [Xenopus tropicalis]|uniref:WAP four-disulfide core domain protein 5-like n=1 Tax=Xenopus tropicalis TaxID=8364 RepID=A0A8J1IYK6_XENTR|nr:WAP four-disulfide core domain protein 5-like [Xenopus tropicalis]KAE8576434.1 hypothetical protein XENTR_v10004184 [Xenopus tropicalis]KAE8576435.1 hypothetical protein XENTR_v10004184 [Xenopus tropicalis]
MKMKLPRDAQTDLMMKTGQIGVLGLLLCAAVFSASADKPGECPPEGYLAEKYLSTYTACQSDDDCGDSWKCCTDNGYKYCKPPAQERPGSCPDCTDQPRTTDYCTSDSMCADGSKCCTQNGGKTCLPSVGDKKGSCRRKTPIMCIVAMRSTCLSDSMCNGDYKCCPSDNGCYNECQKPV